jgi:hypothetical protein
MESGFGTQREGSVKYLGTFNGNFTLRCSPDAAGATARVNKEGKTVHEFQYPHVKGILWDVGTESGDYGPQWVIDINVNSEIYRLKLPANGSSSGMLIRRIPAINPIDVVKINIGSVENDGKDGKKYNNTIFWVEQEVDGVLTKLPDFFREKVGDKWVNKHGYPEAKLIKTTDEFSKPIEKWSFKDQLVFLKDYLETHVKPKLLGNNQPAAQEPPHDDLAHEAVAPENIAEVSDDDDLPF